MNLMKNVDGSWDQSKDKVRKDLDTIQRSVNQILAQINAPSASGALPPANISAANTVTTFNKNGLTSVAVAPDSGLTGDGTVQHPLGFGGGFGSLVTKTFTINIADVNTLSSVPFVLVPAQVGQTFLLVSIGMHSAQTTQFSVNCNATVRWDTVATDLTNSFGVVQGGLTPGVQVDFWTWGLFNFGGAGTPVIARTTLGNPPEMGKALVLKGSADNTSGPTQPGRTQITGAITYYAV